MGRTPNQKIPIIKGTTIEYSNLLKGAAQRVYLMVGGVTVSSSPAGLGYPWVPCKELLIIALEKLKGTPCIIRLNAQKEATVPNTCDIQKT